MKPRDELVTVLAAIEGALENRVEVWRSFVGPDGNVIKRIYYGSFLDTHRGSRNVPQQENK